MVCVPVFRPPSVFHLGAYGQQVARLRGFFSLDGQAYRGCVVITPLPAALTITAALFQTQRVLW